MERQQERTAILPASHLNALCAFTHLSIICLIYVIKYPINYPVHWYKHKGKNPMEYSVAVPRFETPCVYRVSFAYESVIDFLIWHRKHFQ